MARNAMRLVHTAFRQSLRHSSYNSFRSKRLPRFSFLVGAGSLTGLCSWYLIKNKIKSVPQITAAESDNNTLEKQKISMRERRFRAFAALEYDGEIYMSPQDFLESVTQDVPRYRKRRKVLSKLEVSDFLKSTPTKWRGSPTLFRIMGDKGIISYTEYLFLLCVLTKPKSGFEIAFNMFDTDMNQRVDRSEFLVMERVMQARKHEQAESAHNSASGFSLYPDNGIVNYILKHIFGHKMNSLLTTKLIGPGKGKPEDEKNDKNSQGQPTEENEFQETTLLRHFFGRKGNDRLTFEEFCKFMENLQTEALDIEFTEYSKGLQTISESEFARILLRYTKVQTEDYDQYIDQIKKRLTREEPSAIRGIPFNEFKKFFQFLNNLDDFTMAMRMYTLADRPISQQEFQRAVKACVDYTLHPHLVETVFVVFDQDGDGHLSYHEFVCIMKDRLARGLSSTRNSAPNRWEAYRHCVRDVMREKS